MNSVTLIGRLGAGPELRHTNGGTAVCEFSLAVDSHREDPEWVRVVAWSATAEAVAAHKVKGDQIAIEGELRTGHWEHEGEKRSASHQGPRPAAHLPRQAQHQLSTRTPLARACR